MKTYILFPLLISYSLSAQLVEFDFKNDFKADTIQFIDKMYKTITPLAEKNLKNDNNRKTGLEHIILKTSKNGFESHIDDEKITSKAHEMFGRISKNKSFKKQYSNALQATQNKKSIENRKNLWQAWRTTGGILAKEELNVLHPKIKINPNPVNLFKKNKKIEPTEELSTNYNASHMLLMAFIQITRTKDPKAYELLTSVKEPLKNLEKNPQ